MSVEQTDARQPPDIQGRTTAEWLDELARFDGPPEQFLSMLLGLQCRVGGAESGAVLRLGAGGTPEVLAVHPPAAGDAARGAWLREAAALAAETISTGKTAAKPLHDPADLYGEPARRHLLLIPLGAGFPALGAFVVRAMDAAAVQACRDRLEVAVGLWRLYEMQRALRRHRSDLERLRVPMEVLPAVDEHDRFVAAAMALCNEAASRWQCERVSLGFLKGRYVRLRAMSHTEKFSRKMKLVQDIEAAMEECLDQDTEVLWPAEEGATTISRAAAELSARHGPTAVLSVPLRREGRPVAVLTLERPPDRPFTVEEAEAIRLMCELVTARLVALYESDRWFGARFAAWCRRGLAAVVGPHHTWKKLAAVLVAGFVVFLFAAKGDYTADAPFVLEALQRRVVTAPFQGELTEVLVLPGDPVTAGKTVLARLDTTELRLELLRVQAERKTYLRQADVARSEDRHAEVQMALAQAEKAAARIRLLEYRIAQAELKAPITGKVTRGVPEREVGKKVEVGDVLFEIATVDRLRAELAVPEDRIPEVREGQEGELATAAAPEKRIRFVVERVHPVAEVVQQRNVFKVRARLLDAGGPAQKLKPGMEGLAKIHLGRRRLAWLWTRRLFNWIRMKLWL